MKFDEYLTLLDWTGREIRADKRGSIPEELAPILERMQIVSEKWVDLIRNFGRWFQSAVGQTKNLANEAKRRGRSYLQGAAYCRAVFSP